LLVSRGELRGGDGGLAAAFWRLKSGQAFQLFLHFFLQSFLLHLLVEFGVHPGDLFSLAYGGYDPLESASSDATDM
jgi:hypothetical protein